MIAILGSGPHGRQIAAELQARGDLTVMCDDNPAYLHLPSCFRGALTWPWYAGPAWPAARRALVERIIEAATKPGDPLKDPFGRSGTFLATGVQRASLVSLGMHVHVGHNAVLSYGCAIGDYTLVCPSAVLAGDTVVEPDVVVGAGAVIIHGGITIGRGAFVGALTAVIDDVPPGAVVAGNPGKVVAHDWDYRDMATGRRGRKGLATPR